MSKCAFFLFKKKFLFTNLYNTTPTQLFLLTKNSLTLLFSPSVDIYVPVSRQVAIPIARDYVISEAPEPPPMAYWAFSNGFIGSIQSENHHSPAAPAVIIPVCLLQLTYQCNEFSVHLPSRDKSPLDMKHLTLDS